MARPQRILVVEDDIDLRRQIRQALSLVGHDVDEAGNGLHALRVIDSQPPDAVILDLGLPIISGQSVLAEITAHAHTRDIPVVVITGEPGEHDDLGAVHVLRKPFDVDQLVKTMRSCIASVARAKTSVERAQETLRATQRTVREAQALSTAEARKKGR
jgi:DNA-binding response OmpR family regulator